MTRVRRELSSLKQATAQSKLIAERKSENLRAKLGDMSTQALLAKGALADLRVIGGVFDQPVSYDGTHGGWSSRAAQEEEEAAAARQRAAHQLAQDQVQALERERSLHLDQLIALKGVAVECINALREAARKLAFHVAYERAEGGDTALQRKIDAGEAVHNVLAGTLQHPSTSTTAYIGDLFPPLVRLSSSASGSKGPNAEHPAAQALSLALQEVRGQSESLETLRADRSASLQRLLSKAKLQIGEEAWQEANQQRQQQQLQQSSGASSSASGGKASLSADELQAQLKRLQEAYERQSTLLEQTEEAAASARGLLEMYRQQDERTGMYRPAPAAMPTATFNFADVSVSSNASAKSGRDKGKRKSGGSKKEEPGEAEAKLRELEEERQRLAIQRQELARAREAFEIERKQQQQLALASSRSPRRQALAAAAEEDVKPAAASTSISHIAAPADVSIRVAPAADDSRASTSRSGSSRRGIRRPEMPLAATPIAPRSMQPPASAAVLAADDQQPEAAGETSFSQHVSRIADGSIVIHDVSMSAAPAPEQAEDDTMIDHGVANESVAAAPAVASAASTASPRPRDEALDAAERAEKAAAAAASVLARSRSRKSSGAPIVSSNNKRKAAPSADEAPTTSEADAASTKRSRLDVAPVSTAASGARAPLAAAAASANNGKQRRVSSRLSAALPKEKEESAAKPRNNADGASKTPAPATRKVSSTAAAAAASRTAPRAGVPLRQGVVPRASRA